MSKNPNKDLSSRQGDTLVTEWLLQIRFPSILIKEVRGDSKKTLELPKEQLKDFRCSEILPGKEWDWKTKKVWRTRGKGEKEVRGKK